MMLNFTIEKNITLSSDDQRAQLLANLVFGRVFTDHMALIHYNEEKGWHDAKITARQPLPIDPASTVLHYGQEIFEGMKAYAIKEGGVSLFRPEANAQRFNASARRLAMAEIPESYFLQAIEELIKIDKKWVPQGEGQSLYLRPFMISHEAFLGVKPAKNYLFVVLASPVGNYFSGALRAVSVWISEHYTRAALGGTGEAKCGGNYAASLLAQKEANKHGCDQVLFLDAAERRYIEEMGGMNIMFVRRDGSVVTPPLGGTILRGITRDSLLRLGRFLGIEMKEEVLEIEEVMKAVESGEIIEAFACGTAAVVSPIGDFRWKEGKIVVGNGAPGAVTMRLREALCALQVGEVADPFGWVKTLI